MTLTPPVLAWAQRTLGARPAVENAPPTSRVRKLTLPGGTRYYLKLSPRPPAYECETLALRHAAPALGPGRAPHLKASDAQHLALLLTAVEGSPLDQLALTPAEEARAHRQAGTLLARLHAAGDLSGPHRTEAARALKTTADKAEKQLAQAELTTPQRQFVRDQATRLRTLPPLPLAFIHGDARDHNLLWSGPLRQAAWINFDRSRFAAAVQDFVPLARTRWPDRPDLRTACLQGYGRDLTPEEQQALTSLTALDAANRLAHDAPETAADGRRALDRLMKGATA